MGEEIAQAALFDALGLHLGLPCAMLARRQRGQPRLPARQEFGTGGGAKVERGPVVARHADLWHTGRAQRHRERLQRQRQPQCLVIGQRPAGGEMPERARVAVRVVRIAHHSRQLQADLDLQVHRDRRGVLADVVGVVGQGQDLRGQARDQQVARHVADVARAMERHRFLQRGRECMQLPAQARLERAVAGIERGVGGDRRRVFGMEVAPPVHMVAQELDDEFFQQAVVLAVGAEEAGIEHARDRMDLAHRRLSPAIATTSRAAGACARCRT